MTAHQHPPTPAARHDEVEPLLAAHALATLEPGEAAQVDAHLATCAACRVTFDELCAASALVEVRAHEAASGAGEAVALPTGLRGDLLARARATAQEPVQAEAVATTLAAPATQGAHVEPAAPAGTAGGQSRRGGLARILRMHAPALGAVAMMGAVVIALAAQAGDDQDRIAKLEQRLADAKGDQVQVLDGGQVELADGDSAATTKARVTLDREGGRVVFRDVADPPEGMVWQVWQVSTDGRIRSIGVIPDAAEAVALDLEKLEPSDLERVFVTTEPEDTADDDIAIALENTGTA